MVSQKVLFDDASYPNRPAQDGLLDITITFTAAAALSPGIERLRILLALVFGSVMVAVALISFTGLVVIAVVNPGAGIHVLSLLLIFCLRRMAAVVDCVIGVQRPPFSHCLRCWLRSLR